MSSSTPSSTRSATGANRGRGSWAFAPSRDPSPDEIIWTASMTYTAAQPAIIVVEHNSAFGRLPITVPYSDRFSPRADKLIDFGCSIAAWRILLGAKSYAFITVDSSGTNAFFVRIKRATLDKVLLLEDPLQWADCRVIADRLHMDAHRRWYLESNLEYIDVEDSDNPHRYTPSQSTQIVL